MIRSYIVLLAVFIGLLADSGSALRIGREEQQEVEHEEVSIQEAQRVAEIIQGEDDSIRASKRAAAIQALKNKWVYIIGDSSMRIFFGALVARLNGTLADRRFGSYLVHDKGGCEGHEEALGDRGFGCLREYADLRNGIRVTFSFKTYANQSVEAMNHLISPSQTPDMFLLSTGAWDMSYKCGGKCIPPEKAGQWAIRWLKEIVSSYPQSKVYYANVVTCANYYKERGEKFNAEIRKGFKWGKNVILFDREPSTTAVRDKLECNGWHAYRSVALGQVDTWLSMLGSSSPSS